MIVKDEAPIIKRCLESVKPLIDYWVIVDTGSTDGTQQAIQECMRGIPGELHERPWVNFGHNRNEALALAREKGNYLLFIDADERLRLMDGFSLPPLTKDFYYIPTEYSGTHYLRVQLINAALDWRWIGVVHEVVYSPNAHTWDTLPGVVNVVSTEGNRAKDPARFFKDISLLEQALADDPHNTRDTFYLAQSYRDAGEHAKALDAYRRRISLGGWDQEVFWAMLQAALLMEKTGAPLPAVAEAYLKAYEYRPARIEPLYYLASMHRRYGDYPAGYAAALKGLPTAIGDDILFIEKWIYDYGLLLEFSLNAYWTGRMQEALHASQRLLSQDNLPPHVRECVERNVTLINQKLND